MLTYYFFLDQRFTKYLQTFQDEGGVIGVQILPIYGHKDLKTVKQKTVSSLVVRKKFFDSIFFKH